MPTPIERLTAALTDRYRIERELGAGGMATVYLAHDVRHDRRVALKVLRPELAAVIGAQRFLHEIKTTANLQHPHILPLHDSGEVDGTVFYVMPFVAGESLRERLNREKQLPVNDAIRIAREVASALDYAHRHGVIHRDIKPENILLHDGQALVADFGIALAASSASGARLTETGISMGTPQYMSPEQATGQREITARSDIFGLGCVVYEMLVGEPPFTGPTAQAILGKVRSADPPSITAQRKTVPQHVEAAVLMAIEKLPADRFPSAAVFADALDGKLQHVRRGGSKRQLRMWMLWAAVLAGITLGALVTVVALAPDSRGETRAIREWSVPLPDSASLAFIGSASLGLGIPDLALSPNGEVLVYAGKAGNTTRLYRHRVGTLSETVALPGTDGAFSPFFSPDGRAVAFFAGDQLKRVDLNGGSSSVIAEVSEPHGGVWLEGGRIVVANRQGGQLAWVSESGRQLRALAPSNASGTSRYLPASLPDADLVLHQVGPMPGILAVTSLSTGRTRFLTHSEPADSLGLAKDWLFGEGPVYLESGHLVFFAPSENALVAVRFDPQTLRVEGNPVRVLEGVRRESYGGQFALSRTGRIAFAAGGSGDAGRLVWADMTGRIDTLPLPAGTFGQPSLAPDGQRLVIVAATPSGLNELRLYQLNDLARGVTERWVSPFASHVFTEWAPSGGWLAVTVWWPTRVLRVPVPFGAADTIAPRYMELVTASMDSSARSFLANQNQIFRQLSPDGKWLAYTSREMNRWEIYLERFPLTGKRTKISLAGGEESRWSPQGDRIYYRYRDTFYMVPIDRRTGKAGTPTPFITGPFLNVPGISYDVSPDGRRLLLILGPAEQTANHIRFIEGFDDRVRRMLRQ